MGKSCTRSRDHNSRQSKDAAVVFKREGLDGLIVDDTATIFGDRYYTPWIKMYVNSSFVSIKIHLNSKFSAHPLL